MKTATAANASRALKRPLALARTLALCSLAVGSANCSFLLDFDKDIEASIDAEPTEIDAASADARIAEFCDAYEPNDEQVAGVQIDPGSYDAALCATDDVDFYAFSIAVDVAVTVRINFENGDGEDLNLRLLDNAGVVQTEAATSGGVEEIVHSKGSANPLPAGAYALEVYSTGTSNANIDYSLTLEVTPDP